MGILTDPSLTDKFYTFVIKYYVFLTILPFTSGILYFMSLASTINNSGTYFSENALLPGLVEGEFTSEADTRAYLERFTEEMERYREFLPTPWLQGQFRQLGLEVYLHNFTLTSPFGDREIHEGRNVYAILRAPRAASTEALVLSAPFRSLTSVHPGTAPSIAVMLALAKFFRERTYWAKDIIFLVTEHEQLGAKAWLDAYHSTNDASSDGGVLNAGFLPSRSGAIQAAINLEFHGKQTSSLDLKIEGLTGQLPNLDLINLAVKLCGRENVPVTFHNRPNHRHSYSSHFSYDEWIHSFRTLMKMVNTQATGVPNGNHGLFLRYNIEALTLEGRSQVRGGAGRGATLLQLGRVVEGIFRSLNNLEEALHQSFFFYLLPSTERYISIGVYMPPFGLILLTVLLDALKLRIEILRENGTDETGKKANVSTVTGNNSSNVLLSTIAYLVMAHSIGIAAFLAPPFLDALGQRLHLPTEDSITYGSLAIFGAAMLKSMVHPVASWRPLKCATQLEMGIFLATLSLANFSLALLLTVVTVPFIVIVAPTRSRLWRWFKLAMLVLVSPMALLFLATLYDTSVEYPTVAIGNLLLRSTGASKRALFYAVTDYYIYENWYWMAACCFYLPMWLQLWSAQHARIPSQ